MRWRCVVGRILLTGVLGLMAFASPAFAQADERNGTFSCRASLLKLQQAGEDPALEPVIANEQGSPCVDDEAGLLARQIFPEDAAEDEPHAELGILYAKTDAIDDDPATPAADEHAAHAESGVAFVLLSDGENTLIAQVVTAEADARCVDNQPQLSGESAVVSLTILQPGEEPTVIAVPGDNERLALPDTATDDPNDEMALHLNETIEEDTNDDGTNDKLTQRAVWLEAEQGDIILGEAVADFTGNPCERAPEQGRIIIEKETEPEDEQDFTFNGTVDDDGTFQLDDDGNDEGAGPETAGDDDLPNRAAFDRAPGEYNLTEEEVEGFELEDIDCDDENSVENEETRSVVINLEDDETVTCKFKNVREDDEEGRVTVVKDTQPDDPQDFEFRLRSEDEDDEDDEHGDDDDGDDGDDENDFDEEFVLDDDGDPANEQPNSRTFDVPAGEVRIEEEEVDGFTTTVNCEPDQGEEVSQEGRRAEFDLEDGEEVTCTFTNVKEEDEEGRVTVVKDTQPDDPQDFDFRLRSDGDGEVDEENGGDDGDDFDEEFVLDDDGDPANEQPNSRTFDVPAGEVRIEEEEVDGFTTTVNCEPDQGEEVSQEGRRAEFDLEDGEEVTCTFTNVKDQAPQNGTVRVVKDTVPNDNQVFEFEIDETQGTGSFHEEFTLQDNGNEGDGQPSAREFSVTPGRVRIEEEEVDGYTTTVDCQPDQGEEVDQEGRRVEFQLEPGETVECKFTNTKEDDEEPEPEPEPEPGQGTIEIRKAIVNTDPDGAGPFEFEGSGAIGAFSLAHNDEREFNVPAGQYEVEELDDPQDGFRLWRIECDDEAGDETQGPAHGGDNTARIDLDPGEDIKCSFYNARDDDPDPGNSGPGNANSDGDSGGNSGPGLRSRSAGLPLLDRVLGILR